MFFTNPGKPTKLKKTAYLFLSTLLGVLLSFIAHGIIEMNYLQNAESQNRLVIFYGGCALPPILQAGLWAFGIVGGFFLGRLWWRKVYVERVWARK